MFALLFGSIFLASCSKVTESTTNTSTDSSSSGSSSTPVYSYLTATFTLDGVSATNITEKSLLQNEPISGSNSYIYSNSSDWTISPKGNFSKKMPLYSSFSIPTSNLGFTFYVTENAKSYFFVTSNIKYEKNKNLDLGTINLKPRVILTGTLNVSGDFSNFDTVSQLNLVINNGFGKSFDISSNFSFTNSQYKESFLIEYSYGANVYFQVEFKGNTIKTLTVNIPNLGNYTSGSYDVGEIPATL